MYIFFFLIFIILPYIVLEPEIVNVKAHIQQASLGCR